MLKKRYKLASLAQSHLLKIKSYTIQNYSQQQWLHYKSKLQTSFKMLADNPNLGKSCDELYQNGFYFPVEKHTVYFTKEEGFILIVAVLSQSQLPQNHLG